MTTLNEAQQQAVLAGDGPVLVLAGAGSGKTRVIVERLAWLIDERGIDPRRILALTFTNRAAAEMRRRVEERVGQGRVGAWLGTFHSFGLYILRREHERVGLKSGFTVFDDTDQLSLMRRLVKDLDKRLARVSPRDALTWISRYKQDVEKPGPDDEAASDEEEAYRVLWNGYHAALLHASALDFDDLLAMPVRLFETFEDVRDRYRHRYQYVHIDEYQDTNHAQYRLAASLAAPAGNLFAVGDEDQSIYSWRGATIRNILDFEKDFANARVIRLEQNYRSTEAILNSANAVVANNTSRLGKNLWTAQKGGDPVQFYMARDGEDEASFVAEELAHSDNPAGSAVLYRTNGQSRLIEESLQKRKLAYKVVGGVKFYARKEIKDILGYLRLLVNPVDDESLRRVLNVPRRGIGAASLEQIGQYAVDRGQSLLDVIRDVEHDNTLGLRARTAMGAFVQLIDELTLLASQSDEVTPVVEALLDATDFREALRIEDEKDFRTRQEMVDEFVSSCINHDKDDPKGLLAFLQDLSLLTDADAWDRDQPAITLMTCHSAKGLEFDTVYLVGMEEGLLPHASAMDSEAELEEERRLCYVAMTRARKRLVLTAAETRALYGEHARRDLSRFLGEIPRGALRRVGVDEVVPQARREETAPNRKASARPAPIPVDDGKLQMGTRVRHGSFGTGVVMYTSGTGNKMKARIRFDTGRVREFLVNIAPLELLKGK